MGHMWHQIYYIPKPTLELKKIISGIEKDGLLTEFGPNSGPHKINWNFCRQI